MLIFNTKDPLKALLHAANGANNTIGFVPTMGALHQGHLSLLEQSVRENDVTVISIFVNPTQFNNPEDLEKYPRTLDTDIVKIESVSSNIIVFAPTVAEMYEGNTQSSSFNFNGLENLMEGSSRPGHFNGVGTIVKKLFEIVTPANAYFGEKDFQQLLVVKAMVKNNNLHVNVVGCPIHREKNGLAMSSRNERLTADDREKAALIYITLQQARDMFATQSPEAIREYVKETFAKYPEFMLEYFEIAGEDDLRPLILTENKMCRAFIAVSISNIRLIDNIALN